MTSNARALQTRQKPSQLGRRTPMDEGFSSNSSEERRTLHKRADSETADAYWHLSQISFPPNVAFDRDDGLHQYTGLVPKYRYRSDDSWGKGQTIYVIESLPVNNILVSNILYGTAVPPWPLDSERARNKADLIWLPTGPATWGPGFSP